MFSTGRPDRTIDLQESLKKHGGFFPPWSTDRLRISRGDRSGKLCFSGEDCIMQRCMSPPCVSASHRILLVLLEEEGGAAESLHRFPWKSPELLRLRGQEYSTDQMENALCKHIHSVLRPCASDYPHRRRELRLSARFCLILQLI